MKKLLFALALATLCSGCMTGKFIVFAAKKGWKDATGSKERIAFPPPFEGLEKYTK